MDVVAATRAFAARAHAGQLYGSEPYIVHPERVAQRVAEQGGTPAMQAAAWLHDTVEDGHATVAELAARFGVEVAGLVDDLTRRPGETYMGYIARAGRHEAARRIKLADLAENATNPPPGLERRYRRAIQYLRGLEAQ